MLIYVRLLFYILKPNKMSDYTQKEIEEMRKRLPFKAEVWDTEDRKCSIVINHLFNNGSCADNVRRWSYFKEIKEPEYVPFTIDDFEEFAGKWIINESGECLMIIRFNRNLIRTATEGASFNDALHCWKFADTGKPFGKEVV